MSFCTCNTSPSIQPSKCSGKMDPYLLRYEASEAQIGAVGKLRARALKLHKFELRRPHVEEDMDPFCQSTLTAVLMATCNAPKFCWILRRPALYAIQADTTLDWSSEQGCIQFNATSLASPIWSSPGQSSDAFDARCVRISEGLWIWCLFL